MHCRTLQFRVAFVRLQRQCALGLVACCAFSERSRQCCCTVKGRAKPLIEKQRVRAKEIGLDYAKHHRRRACGLMQVLFGTAAKCSAGSSCKEVSLLQGTRRWAIAALVPEGQCRVLVRRPSSPMRNPPSMNAGWGFCGIQK